MERKIDGDDDEERERERRGRVGEVQRKVNIVFFGLLRLCMLLVIPSVCVCACVGDWPARSDWRHNGDL